MSLRLLRFFEDDSLEMREHCGARHSKIELVSTESHDRFEKMLRCLFWRYSPVAAIGQAGTRLQSLGAVREDHSDDFWLNAVRKHVGQIGDGRLYRGPVPSRTREEPHGGWRSPLAKTMFLLHSQPRSEIHRCLAVFPTALDLDPATSPRSAVTNRLLEIPPRWRSRLTRRQHVHRAPPPKTQLAFAVACPNGYVITSTRS